MFIFLFALSLTSSALAKSNTINVFLIPHSHCDPGWLETYEGYHTRFVERILTGVMESLARSPDRRFVWAEISYFSRWFDTKNQAVKQQVRKFVENGQLEFVEGGWVQPDEANTNFDILVNQLTEGHDYLLKNFGVRPRFAWQIDPFGHSSLTPTLAAAVGFDALVINRIHHNLKSYFKQTRHMEFVWQGSATLGEESEIFTHVLHTHYSAPLGFDFEEGNVSPVGSNVRARTEQLVRELKSRSSAYRTPNLLVTFGDDFKFQRAEHQFSNMDTIIAEINKGDYGVKIKYATLSEYFDAVFAAKTDFPLYKGDFFPYADNSDSYWTGYYTTRPHLKGLTRRATSILHSAETAYAIARTQEATRHLPTFWDSQYRNILQGRRDTALVQHHDGITGTAKPHVADDYTHRLDRAVSASHQIIADMTKHLLYNSEQEANTLEDVSFGVYDAEDRLFNLASSEDEYPLVYHNALGWARQQYVQVKVSAPDAAKLRVYDADGNAVPCQTSPFTQNPGRPGSDGSVFFLNFMAEVPPLGMSTYFVRRVTATASTEAPYTHQAQYFTHSQLAGASAKALRIENEFLQLTLRPETGLPERLVNKLTKQEITLHQTYAEYHTARSGAYIFRPAGVYESTFQAQVAIVTGDLMSEVTIFLGGNRHLILRLYTAPHDPLDYPEIGGVLFTTHQVNADGNREVVVRYTTDIDAGDSFYTDNGLELQLRSRNGNQVRSRAHIEASRADAQETQYYPSISIAALRQPDRNLQFTVVSSQAFGTTSFRNGGLEIMLHRHLSQDDGRGLGEGVRDTNVIKVQQWLMLGRVADAELHRRRLSLQQDHPLTPLALDKYPDGFEWSRHFVNAFRPLTGSLPANVHLLSLKARDAVSSEVALRLVHIAEGVDSVASPEKALPDSFQWETSVKLDDLFGSSADADKDNNGWSIAHPRPRSLTLNYDADEVEQRVRYDSSLGLLSMKIDFGRLDRGGSQNTNEEGVFLSQAALDKMELERANQRKPLAIAHDDGDDEDYEGDSGARPELVDDAQVYRERSVRLRGEQRRVFDPTSISVDAARQRQRRLLAIGRNEDPLTMVLRPLQMKSLLVVLASRGVQVLMGDGGRDNMDDNVGDDEKRPVEVIVGDEVDAEPPAREDIRDDAKDNDNKKSDDEIMKAIVKAKEAEKKRAEEERREKERKQREQEEEEEEEERKRRERAEEERRSRERQQDADADSEASEVTERKAEASPQLPRTQADVLAEEQRFLSTGLEGERMMMMFLTIIIISLMIAVYLSFHRRHASAIISVSSLAAAAYPWSGSSSSSVASPAGKDFYRREMDQRLYSKMV